MEAAQFAFEPLTCRSFQKLDLTFSPTCPNGHALEYYPESQEDPFYTSRLAASCPECGAPFDPTQLVATGRNGWTGDEFQIQGGASSRFALVVDCGKFFGDRQLRFQSELKTLVEDTLGHSTYEVEDFY